MKPRVFEALVILTVFGGIVSLANYRELLGTWTSLTGKKRVEFTPKPLSGNGVSLDPKNLPSIEVDILPEFIRALDSAVPTTADCIKVRYKWVPVRSVKVNGVTLHGVYKARYRGYCSPHWFYKQRSIKIESESGDLIDGRRGIDLNALNTDAEFFDSWATHLYSQLGGVALRVGYTKFFLNGEYNGLRSFSESLDNDTMKIQGFPKGSIYREAYHANLGVDWQPPQNYWKKNSKKSQPWTDWINLNRSIHDSVLNNSEEFLKFLNLPHTLNYYAFLNIVGTSHVNDHNIPMYRPSDSSQFVPIVYDLAGNYMGTYSQKFKHIQVPSMSVNLLSGLISGNPKFRKEVHLRTAKMLEEIPNFKESRRTLFNSFRSTVLADLRKGLALDHPSYKTEQLYLASIEKELQFTENRIEDLTRGYLAPIAHINSDWATRDSFQMVIDGYGMYSLQLRMKADTCKKDDRVSIRFHTTEWQTAAECLNSRWKLNDVIVERNDLVLPEKPSGADLKMHSNSIGSIWVEIKQSDQAFLEDIKIVSIQTENEIPLFSDWPFRFKSARTGELNLFSDLPIIPKLTPLLSLEGAEGFSVSSVEVFEKDKFDPTIKVLKKDEFTLNGSILKISEKFKQKPRADLDEFGPLLCYHLPSGKGCFEFSRSFLTKTNLVNEAYFIDTESKENIVGERLANEQINACKKFTFSKKRWLILKSLRFPSECSVLFESGAELLLGEGAYILIEGPVTFPLNPPLVRFDSFGKNEWGGLILRKNPNETVIQNLLFKNSNEFMFDDIRITGALNLIQVPKYKIRNNIFFDNKGDDGLNAKGGIGEINSNLFAKNRDAMDVDIGEASVYRNIVVNTADDGMDSGTAKTKIFDNYISSAGDKGLSLGEGSNAVVERNVIRGNNVGTGVKDGSKTKFSGNLYTENEIGLSVYNKRSQTLASSDSVQGDSYFFKNKIPFELNGKINPPLITQKRTSLNAAAALKKILSHCSVCKTKEGVQILETLK
jgi:hypothetical protein